MVRLTPEQRAELHAVATSSDKAGMLHRCRWFHYPKMDGPQEISEDKQLAIISMGHMMFENTAFSKLSLHVYKMLHYKLKNLYSPSEVVVLIKGSSALALYFATIDEYKNCFPFSDIDITIFVNPLLENYDEVFLNVRTIVGQVFAKHKQYMDRIFFKLNREVTPPDFDIIEFIDRHIAMCEEIEMLSPFINDEIRNACSFNSFSIVPHNTDSNVVVKISEPHFTCAEMIPLDKTPIFCSINDTLDDVVLYRMKWNVMDSNDERFMSIDFIDCIIPRENNVELQDFVNNGGFNGNNQTVIERFDMQITIFDLPTLRNDLWKCLNEYDCPESKRRIRGMRYTILNKYIEDNYLNDIV